MANHTEELESGSETSGVTFASVVSGPDQGKSIELKAGKAWLLGTGDDCDLKLTDPSVSRQHARLEVAGATVRINDLKSTNGTRYLGARVEQVAVPRGSSVVMGRTVLRLGPPMSTIALSDKHELAGLIGRSTAMRELFALIERLAPSDSALLLQGETGTGKEVVARAVHSLSPRRNQPMVVLDCGATAHQLIESELFGHAAGAFTGADQARRGLIQQANGGTLFLDEIGELPLELQPKLLRVLETKKLRRVGETHEEAVDVRIIAATHRNLFELQQAGKFRSDLYYRLAVATLNVPSLRERLDDIPDLARRFARNFAGKPVDISRETIAALQSSQWKGNVRELRNSVERMMALGMFTQPGSAPAEAEAAKAPTYHDARDRVLEEFERRFLTEMLEQHDGNVSAVARAADLARSHLYKLLIKHGLKVSSAGSADEDDD